MINRISLKNILNPSNELSKFIISSLVMLCTLYVLSILKGSKDTLIVIELGAELISTIKLYGVLPFAVIFTLIYIKLTNTFTRLQIYLLLNFCFISFFIIFDLFLYPNADILHFNLQHLELKFPIFKYQFIMISNWSFTLFYITSELWGNVMLALMFWQVINQLYTIEQARKYYPLFGIIGELGLFLSGIVMTYFTSAKFTSDWSESLDYITFSIVTAGILISIFIHILSTNIVDRTIINGRNIKSTRPKLSLIESFKYIISSKYMMLVIFIVLSYGISINVLEGVWKKHASLLYTSAIHYGHFIAKIQMATSIVTIICIFFSLYTLKYFNWCIAALITPIIMIFTGIPFFVFAIFKDDLIIFTQWTEFSSLTLCVLFGAIQNILSKGTKYSFFIPTKEMAFIPLTEDLKAKGKSVSDIIGERFGKSFGALIQWLILSFITNSTLITIAPYLFIIYLITLIIWVIATIMLNKKYKAIT